MSSVAAGIGMSNTLIEAIEKLPLRPARAEDSVRKSQPDIQRTTIIRWARDLQRNLTQVGSALQHAEDSPLSEKVSPGLKRPCGGSQQREKTYLRSRSSRSGCQPNTQ